MSVSTVATSGVKGALSGIWGIVTKYVLPLGFTMIGFGMGSVTNVGCIIDQQVGGNAMVSKFWKEGYGRLIGAALFLSIGVSLIIADGAGLGGAIKGAIGGILVGSGLFQLQEGAGLMGVA